MAYSSLHAKLWNPMAEVVLAQKFLGLVLTAKL